MPREPTARPWASALMDRDARAEGAVADPSAILAARDPFELFGLPRRFAIDGAALRRRMLELSRQTHPDFAGADEQAQRRAMDLSARVNEAHRILEDDEQRANCLLRLLGGPDGEQDKSLPDGFLVDMMELREQLAEAQEGGDHTLLARFESDARARRRQRLDRVASLFSAEPPPLPEIRTELNALRYIERMIEQLHPEHRPAL